ncbi:unnamed protein product [Paramecium sonneborni]|uniref:Insulin-like growth factor binding protein, N-terminal n=1 Tax=Paramecium sonneborni TaxID=65129 RepID=A0A8S1QK08_9CILI|nr:unnamed protein product [Paramecium sonneborni]
MQLTWLFNMQNLDECTSCDQSSSNQYNTLLNGVCLSLTPSTSNPIVCNQYCETCTRTLKTNCSTCVSDYHRSLQSNQCLCQKGFYDDGINLYCLPICGDLLIVDGEDCDDGNFNPYDGCNNCKKSCDVFCKECLQGFCYECQDGFQMINHKCIQICDDNISQCSIQISQCYICNVNLLSNSVNSIKGNPITSIQLNQCYDSNVIAWDDCFQGNFNCPQFCLSCVYGDCLKYDKSSGYGLLDKLNNKCTSICGDGLKSIDEDCDDGNDINYDGCFKCFYSCHLNCQDCLNGICQQCQYGYYLNQKDNSCFSICGDGIIANNEECDILNLVDNYECSNCQIKCQSECLICYEGLCYQCKDNVNLFVEMDQFLDRNNVMMVMMLIEMDVINVNFNVNNNVLIVYLEFVMSVILKVECGDLVIVQNEDCDDGNQLQYDGCFECQFQCQVECADCKQGICYECGTLGYHLTNGFCHSICGDGIVVQSYEECDDGNSYMYDGCYQCQFQCQEMCTQCQLGICYECNEFGWIIENHVCKPFCGDGIIKDYEQCDDMNNYINDGCHQCLFQCDQYCIDCLEGICQQCELGRYLFQNVCYSQCGDGNYVKTAEYCDDGNQENGDGCDKNCQIENNFTCKSVEGSYSQCIYSKQPQFQIIILPTYFGEYQDIQIKFDQKMKYFDAQSSSLIISTIIDMNDSDYDIKEQIIKSDPQNEISDIIIQLRINFYAPIERPILKIQFLNDTFVSKYNLTLEQTIKTKQLQSLTVLSQSQINVAQKAATYNEALIFTLFISRFFRIISNLMDQLQYLSYVKYISIQFPPNLNIYFEVFKIITIEPIIQNMGINKIFNLIYQEEFYQIPNDGKILNDGINVNFLENFKSFLFCLIIAYMAYYFYKTAHLILSKFQSQLLSKLNLTLTKIYYSIRQKCLLQSKDFFYNAILRVFMSNAYDISFAMTVQIAYFSNNTLRESITSYFSFVIFISYIGTSIYFYYILQKFSTSNTFKVKQKYAALFEGVKNPKNTWIAQYNAILLIKKFVFISLIVFLQKEGKLQSLLIATNQTLFLLYFMVNKPLNSYHEYQKIIITESIIIVNTITFILYDYITDIGLSQNIRIIIGWIHIFTFSTILSISLIIDIFYESQF